jgi:hypothetical protein
MSDTATVSQAQFADFAFTTHVLMAVLVLLVGVFVFGSLGLWARRG